jgi:hypothetical protein
MCDVLYLIGLDVHLYLIQIYRGKAVRTNHTTGHGKEINDVCISLNIHVEKMF